MTGQVWVRSSLHSLRGRLEAINHPGSAPTVGRLLRDLGYALHEAGDWAYLFQAEARGDDCTTETGAQCGGQSSPW